MKGRVGSTVDRAIRLLAIGCLVVLATVGASASGHAQPPAPSITVDAAQYAPGATVTFTGTDFVCSETAIDVSLVPGGPIATFQASAEGTFMGTFAAPTEPGTYELVAEQTEACIVSTTFEVVAPPSTTPATTSTTTTTTPATTPATTSPEATTSTAAATTTSVATGGGVATTSPPLPSTGPADVSGAMVAVAVTALGAGLALLVVSRRKPS